MFLEVHFLKQTSFKKCLKKECEKEKMTADEVIFLLLNLQKKISLNKHFYFRFGTTLIIFLFIDVKDLVDR